MIDFAAVVSLFESGILVRLFHARASPTLVQPRAIPVGRDVYSSVTSEICLVSIAIATLSCIPMYDVLWNWEVDVVSEIRATLF